VSARFVYPDGGQHWYLNPNNADTNNDGLLDHWSVRCCRPGQPHRGDFQDDCDSDKDGIPNVFEVDNDGDACRIRVDLSPGEWVGTRTWEAQRPVNTWTQDFTKGDNRFIALADGA